jgi:DNA-binding GntR family transcriptional regulator
MTSVTNSGTGNGDLGGAEPRRWVRLMRRLRGQVADGTFALGTALPSIATLAEESGYSRQTCGKVLRQMEREGLAVRIPGLGYYVTDASPDEEPARR